jgi:hypothetical protein
LLATATRCSADRPAAYVAETDYRVLDRVLDHKTVVQLQPQATNPASRQNIQKWVTQKWPAGPVRSSPASAAHSSKAVAAASPTHTRQAIASLPCHNQTGMGLLQHVAGRCSCPPPADDRLTSSPCHNQPQMGLNLLLLLVHVVGCSTSAAARAATPQQGNWCALWVLDHRQWHRCPHPPSG